MLFPEEGIGASLFPQDLSRLLNDYYQGKGVHVLPRCISKGLTRNQDKLALNVGTVAEGLEHRLETDAVVAGIGIKPNVRLLEQAGLAVDNGIVVDERLRTENPDIFAAGDVAIFYNASLAMRMRAEHEDNAITMGRYAGRNVAGDLLPYHHLPYFY